ncbi:O-antigen ligase family protein [Bizionia gelidisalsuginis]|uniref:O-antigen ligase family protein n=1 Tax=Bizionia gelidisalsuginis TaxID=291188 RepID=UPI001FEAAD9A|nr:O-antigen ligase family protein [Bizionia gelidisalsuginis]
MKTSVYIFYLLVHLVLGVLVALIPFVAQLYLFGVLIYFVFKILSTTRDQRPLYILLGCGYLVGVEVFIRMTGGAFFYEVSKYGVILFCLIGVFTTGASKKALPYYVYLILLIPGILVAGFTQDANTIIRKAIAFNLSGPVCLGIVAVYCYQRKVSYKHMHAILLAMALPIVTMSTYLFWKTPDLRDMISGTGSNFASSGGFGPNQVSTVLGIGMFVFTVRFFMRSPSILLKCINLFLLAVVSFRAIVTFSRGGVITAVVMILFFVVVYFRYSKPQYQRKLIIYSLLFIGMGGITWGVSSYQTNGFIDKRYANEDALGREKEDLSTGRTELIAFELNAFYSNPVLGVGVGKVKELRYEKENIRAASHNELSRILSEHGLFGLIAFLILFITPLVMRMENKYNIFFYSCFLFWFLTINHSSMRIAAPAFIYGLCLLNIQYETPRLSRK